MEIKPLDMQVNSIWYSLKIWLTSVAVAPLMFLMVSVFTSKEHYVNFEDFMNAQIAMYAACVLFGAIFSFFTWVLFILIIKGIITWFSMFPPIKLVISFIGVLLTLGTFSIFLLIRNYFMNFFRSWYQIAFASPQDHYTTS